MCVAIARSLAPRTSGATGSHEREESVRPASSDDPLALETRAAARAEIGDFEGALADSAAALELALVRGMEPLAMRIRAASEGYRQRQPYRDPIARAAP